MCYFLRISDRAPPRPPLPHDTAPPRPPPPETDDEDEMSFPVPQENQPIMVRIHIYDFLFVVYENGYFLAFK